MSFNESQSYSQVCFFLIFLLDDNGSIQTNLILQSRLTNKIRVAMQISQSSLLVHLNLVRLIDLNTNNRWLYIYKQMKLTSMI